MRFQLLALVVGAVALAGCDSILGIQDHALGADAGASSEASASSSGAGSSSGTSSSGGKDAGSSDGSDSGSGSGSDSGSSSGLDSGSSSGDDSGSSSGADAGCEVPSAQCTTGNAVQSCTASGTWGSPVACVDQTCKGGQCVGICAPGQTQCTADTTGIQSCGADGTWGPIATCPNQTCVDGSADGGTGTPVCAGVCAPLTVRCADADAGAGGQNGVQTCDAQGQWGSVAACSASSTCDTGDAGVASCQGSCGPGQTTCSGNAVEACENGTFGPPVACKGSTPSCLNGTCVACTPQTMRCSGDTPQTCNTAGQWVSDTACPYVCTGAGQCTGNCVPGSTGCTSPYSWTCPSGTQVQGPATIACGATCTPGAIGTINCLNCATETCTSSGSAGQCSAEGACPANSTGTCTWTGYSQYVPAGSCPPTPVTCSSTCGWESCTPSPGEFAPSPGVGGVGSGYGTSQSNPGTSGPNCFGSSNNYGPYAMCPTGSHATSATCAMVVQNGGVTDGSCSDSFPSPNQVVLTVNANSNCSVAAHAYLVIVCAPDSCGTGTPGP